MTNLQKVGAGCLCVVAGMVVTGAIIELFFWPKYSEQEFILVIGGGITGLFVFPVAYKLLRKSQRMKALWKWLGEKIWS
jgi:hypothetical protein